MRHRKAGRSLNVSSSHKHAMLRNLVASLILSERETDPELDESIPKVKGRIITTLAKAKEVRPFAEKCITLARSALPHMKAAEEFETSADRESAEWKSWRKSARYRDWNKAMAPAVAVRRRLIQILHNKKAVSLLISDIAPRFEDRSGGYLRIVRLAKPRLGDAGVRAMVEFTGVRDRRRKKKSAASTAPVIEG